MLLNTANSLLQEVVRPVLKGVEFAKKVFFKGF